MFFSLQLALRAGNEKEEGETADTVGCCSLRVEHIKLYPKLDDQEYVVEFDFLGKDSIRYYNKIPVEKRVWKEKDREGKEGGEEGEKSWIVESTNQWFYGGVGSLFDRCECSVNEGCYDVEDVCTDRWWGTKSLPWALPQRVVFFLLLPEFMDKTNTHLHTIGVLCFEWQIV